MIGFGILLLTALVVLTGWQILVGYQTLELLRQIKDLLKLMPRRSHHPDHGLTNYSTWTYRNGSWGIVETRAENGFVSGDPPRRPGSYEGETVRRPAVRGR